MSPLQREAFNKRRREGRAAKRLFQTPQTRRQINLNYYHKKKNNVQTTCIQTPSPWQTLNGSQSFYSLLVISLPREYQKRW
jgi:hypothetical protein